MENKIIDHFVKEAAKLNTIFDNAKTRIPEYVLNLPNRLLQLTTEDVINDNTGFLKDGSYILLCSFTPYKKTKKESLRSYLLPPTQQLCIPVYVTTFHEMGGFASLLAKEKYTECFYHYGSGMWVNGNTIAEKTNSDIYVCLDAAIVSYISRGQSDAARDICLGLQTRYSLDDLFIRKMDYVIETLKNRFVWEV